MHYLTVNLKDIKWNKLPKIALCLGIIIDPWISKKSDMDISSKYLPMTLKILSSTQFWMLFIMAVSEFQNTMINHGRVSRDLLKTEFFEEMSFHFWPSQIIAHIKLYLPWDFQPPPTSPLRDRQVSSSHKSRVHATWVSFAAISVTQPNNNIFSKKFQWWCNYVRATLSWCRQCSRCQTLGHSTCLLIP